MELRHISEKLAQRADLSTADVAAMVNGLVSTEVSTEAKIAALENLSRKGETAEEIAAFAMELWKLTVPVVPSARFADAIDVCGTGADRAGTFNVSSTVMFVLAAAGVPVTKHGNRSITSKSGSADVLEALGACVQLEPAAATAVFEELGISFFFAPLYHPAFSRIAPVRRALADRGVRTVFNLLGPLINPARPGMQLVGIFARDLTATYARVLQLMGLRAGMVVHGTVEGWAMGIDELSTAGPTHVASFRGAAGVETSLIDSRAFGISRTAPEHLAGGSAAENAELLRRILSGRHPGPAEDLVVFNAAAAFVVAGRCAGFPEGIALAREVVRSGRGEEKLDQFVGRTRSIAAKPAR